MVEHDGEPHTINLCLKCYNFRQEERKEQAMNGGRWKILVGDKNSRANCRLTGVHADSKNKRWECYAAKKMFASSLLEDATTALRSGKR